jgi:hypothetical protein
MLSRIDDLRKLVEMIVYAKEKGMMDHREAKELWLKAMTEAEKSEKSSVQRAPGA